MVRVGLFLVLSLFIFGINARYYAGQESEKYETVLPEVTISPPVQKKPVTTSYGGKNNKGDELWRESGKGQDSWRESGKGQDAWRESGKGQDSWRESGKGADSWRESGKGADSWRESGKGADSWRESGKGADSWRGSDNYEKTTASTSKGGKYYDQYSKTEKTTKKPWYVRFKNWTGETWKKIG